MIDEQKIIGMIPSKALEGLTPEDDAELKSFIEEGFSFPWHELGKYQVVVSLLPLSLQLEIPDPQLKDNVALRLIKLAEEIRLKKLQEEEELRVQQEKENPVEEFPVQIENDVEVVTEDITFKDPAELEPFNLDEIPLPDIEEVNLSRTEDQEELQKDEPVNLIDYQATETHATSVDIPSFEAITVTQEQIAEQTENVVEEFKSESNTETFETPEPESFNPLEVKQTEEITELKAAESVKKSLTEKMLRALELDLDSLKNSFDETEKRLTKNLLLAYVAIAILLALLIFTFFKFTSDINLLEKKVDSLQKPGTSELIEQKNFNHHFSSLC